MTHLPHNPSHGAATKDDVALLNLHFDRMEDRMDSMQDRMDIMQRNFLAVSFGTLTVMTAIFSLITRI